MSPILIAVEPLSRRTKLSLLFGLWHPLSVDTTRILLVDEEGVMLTVMPVMSVKVVDDVVNVSVLVVLTTCNTRKAPRRRFIFAAVRTSAGAKLVGSAVGVAMMLLL